VGGVNLKENENCVKFLKRSLCIRKCSAKVAVVNPAFTGNLRFKEIGDLESGDERTALY
jgi:hypothetical protein